jgi:hypothetical protein
MRLTLRGADVPSDVAMAVVLDHLLGKGFISAGFTRIPFLIWLSRYDGEASRMVAQRIKQEPLIDN